MKHLIVALAALALLSCSKEKSSTMPVKANPVATETTLSIFGKTILLDASKSAGDIDRYGWALDISSPTQVNSVNTIAYTPSSFHKGSDFIPIVAIVTKPGEYVFGLTVYNAAGEQDYSTVTINIK